MKSQLLRKRSLESISVIVRPDQFHYVGYHPHHMVSVIAMGFAVSKDRVDQISAPVHLQRLKTLHFLVCRLNAFPAVRIIIFHHHRVDPKLDQFRLLNTRRNSHTRTIVIDVKKRFTTWDESISLTAVSILAAYPASAFR